MKYIYKIAWGVITIIEKFYWFIKRKVQKDQFNKCGKNVFISRYCHFNGMIEVGDDIYIGQGCRLQSTSSKIILGNHIMLGPNVSIHGGNHRTDIVGRLMKSIKLSEKRVEDDLDVIIENDVWVAANVIILKGVRIGEGSIIGAGCVISDNIPPYTIVTGNVLRKNRPRWTDEDIARHKLLLNNSI